MVSIISVSSIYAVDGVFQLLFRGKVFEPEMRNLLSCILPAVGASSDQSLDDKTFEFLLRSIRRHVFRLYGLVNDNLLRELYELMTSVQSAPIVHRRGWFSYATGRAGNVLNPVSDTGNVRKMMNAAVVAVMDMEFNEKQSKLVQHNPATLS